MHPAIATATLVTASSGRHFHIGPWIIIPVLILVASVSAAIVIAQYCQKRRSGQRVS